MKTEYKFFGENINYVRFFKIDEIIPCNSIEENAINECFYIIKEINTGKIENQRKKRLNKELEQKIEFLRNKAYSSMVYMDEYLKIRYTKKLAIDEEAEKAPDEQYLLCDMSKIMQLKEMSCKFVVLGQITNLQEIKFTKKAFSNKPDENVMRFPVESEGLYLSTTNIVDAIVSRGTNQIYSNAIVNVITLNGKTINNNVQAYINELNSGFQKTK